MTFEEIDELAREWCDKNVPKGIPEEERTRSQNTGWYNDQLVNIHDLNDRLVGFFMNCYRDGYLEGQKSQPKYNMFEKKRGKMAHRYNRRKDD